MQKSVWLWSKKLPNQLKRSTKYFSFQKSSAHQHGRAFGVVDGNFAHWCCGDLNIFAHLPLPRSFGTMDLSMHPAQWMDFFPVRCGRGHGFRCLSLALRSGSRDRGPWTPKIERGSTYIIGWIIFATCFYLRFLGICGAMALSDHKYSI